MGFRRERHSASKQLSGQPNGGRVNVMNSLFNNPLNHPSQPINSILIDH